MKKNKEHISVCRCLDSKKFQIWQIREAVDIAVGDDGMRSKEVLEILKITPWEEYATIT